MKSFRMLLEIEEESNFWGYHINNSYLWPMVRGEVLPTLIERNHGYLNPFAGGNRLKMFKPIFLRELIKTHDFFKSEKKSYDAIFFTTEASQSLNKSTQVYYDRLHAPFYNSFHSPLIFRDSFRFKIFRPTEHERSTYLKDYIPLMIKMKSYRDNSSKYDADILDFCKEINERYSYPYPKKITTILRAQLPKVRYYLDYVDDIVKRVDGDIAFIHYASGLGIIGEITRRLKEHNITTVELQHGYVSQTHRAYNYPSGESEQIMKEYLPDYFLTFGRYWGEQIRTPSTVVTIGNPTLSRSVEDLKRVPPRSNSILVVSQGIVTHLMVRITKYLSKTFPDYTIIFKPHPGEVPFTERYEELNRYQNVQIRTYDNIYELIASNEIIVGYTSTTLFEAVAFDGKRIFIVNNDMIPDYLGYKFSSCEDLRDAILDDESGYPSVQPSYFWDPNWEANISSFLNRFSL